MLPEAKHLSRCVHDYVILQQDVWWHPAGSPLILVDDMELTHKQHTKNFLVVKNAEEWAQRHLVGMLAMAARDPDQFAQVDWSLQAEGALNCPEEYLLNTPFVKRLTKDIKSANLGLKSDQSIVFEHGEDYTSAHIKTMTKALLDQINKAKKA